MDRRRNDRHQPLNTRRGQTLMEVLIVCGMVGIVGLLAAKAVSSWMPQFLDQRLRRQANTDLRAAQDTLRTFFSKGKATSLTIMSPPAGGRPNSMASFSDEAGTFYTFSLKPDGTADTGTLDLDVRHLTNGQSQTTHVARNVRALEFSLNDQDPLQVVCRVIIEAPISKGKTYLLDPPPFSLFMMR